MTTRFTIDQELRHRFDRLDTGLSLSAFAKQALIEKIKRLEGRDQKTRLKTMAEDTEYLKSLIRSVMRGM